MRTKINRKSDFDFIVLDSEGNAIDLPSNDFTLDIWTWGSVCRFRASSIGGVLKGCKNDGGKLRIYVDNPGFAAGKLVGELVSFISNEEYQDGTQRTYYLISDFGIDMVDESTQINDVQVVAMMQYIKGASAYEIACEYGFEGTEQEWLDSLALPSVQAAKECRQLMTEFSTAETKREENENVRIANEETRAQQESARATAEEQRTQAEANRRIAENTRDLAETTRNTVEQNRKNAEAARVSAENTRKTAEDARIANEATRQTNEQARVTAETNRESAETNRADAEAARVEAEAARAEEFAGFATTLAAKEDVANKTLIIDAASTDKEYPSAKAVLGFVENEISFKEDVANKVTSINADADDSHYPSAKAVKDAMGQAFNVIRPDMLPSYNKIDPNRLIIGKYVTNSGSINIGSEMWMSEFIDVLGLKKVYSSGYGVGIQIYAYDSNFNFISAVSRTGNEYTLAENARYIRLSGAVKYIESAQLYTEEETKNYAYGITKGMIHSDKSDVIINGTINALTQEVRTIKTSNQYINKINYLTDWIDGYILVNGVQTTNANGCVSHFIDVLGLDVFYSNIGDNGDYAGYDKNRNYIKNLPHNNGRPNIEEGIRYVRLSYSAQDEKSKLFLYTNADYVASVVWQSTLYAYGITYTDVEQSKLLEPIPEKLDKFHTAYINSLNQFSVDMVEKEGVYLTNNNTYVNVANKFYSKYIPVVGGKIITSNLQSSGLVNAYNKNKEFLGTVSGWKYDNNVFSNYVGYVTLPDDCAFIRFSANISVYSEAVLYIGSEVVYKKYKFGETFDTHFKYRNKKLVTIGDSLTYQATWQRRLCELTGMTYNRKEVRGADESVKTEGYGYIMLDSSLEDTDTYFEAVDGIEKTEETIVDGFGYAHPIWTDAEGNKYRQPCRMAEGGETVMPVGTTSIYSRASDSKYYNGDVIIVFAGANDKVSYINKYPTNGDLSTIQGVTNLKMDSEDTKDATFEIYTDDIKLEKIGDYSDVGEITGMKKYNYTFRACFRGLLKKVVDANPNAEIIVIAPFATMIKGNTYISRGYDYLTKVQNEVIAECAREFSCQCIDLMPLFGRYNAAKYFSGSDGTVYIHPTTAGGEKIANYIASKIL